MTSSDPLAQAVLEALARDPEALDRLRDLVGNSRTDPFANTRAPAYTVATLAAEVGRSERSIRGAIHRGELEAVKRGRGWVISADAVAAWATATPSRNTATRARRPVNRDTGVMARALKDTSSSARITT